MINLYTSLVLPKLEYAVPVWQMVNCQPLDRIQRKGLAPCLGLPSTASKDALEVLAGVLPLDLRREELSVRECGKIMAKNMNQNIAKCLVNFRESYGKCREKFQSPFSCMLTQLEDMKSLTTIALNSIEPEFSYLEYLQPSRIRPVYWNNLVSSKSRTHKQEEDARQLISSLLSDIDSKSAVAFTDGSCRGNPGPCGAGACILLPNTDLIELKQPVSKSSSILIGELVAIKMTLQAPLNEKEKFNINKVRVLSDSQSAVGIVDLGWDNKTHKFISTEILQLRKELELTGVTVYFDWTPGHAGIKGNDIADRLAKEAAKEADEMSDEDLRTGHKSK